MYCESMKKIIESKMTYLESESESEGDYNFVIINITSSLTLTQILVQLL